MQLNLHVNLTNDADAASLQKASFSMVIELHIDGDMI